jgi:hypothetical protein
LQPACERKGEYEQTTDRRYLLRDFTIEKLTNERNYYGVHKKARTAEKSAESSTLKPTAEKAARRLNECNRDLTPTDRCHVVSEFAHHSGLGRCSSASAFKSEVPDRPSISLLDF